MSSTYPEDEFDRPDPDAPVGVHRRPPSKWRPVIPFLIILVFIPLLAWGFSSLLMRDTTPPAAEPQSSFVDTVAQQSGPQSASVPVAPVDEKVETSQSANVIEPPGQETTDNEDIDYDVDVVVLNNSDTAGLAATQAELLEDHGFTDATAENADGWATEVNTVYFAEATMQPTAERVAELLGIDRVEEYDSAGAEGSIVVVIVD